MGLWDLGLDFTLGGEIKLSPYKRSSYTHTSCHHDTVVVLSIFSYFI